ncbi:PSD1 and planctomycete cytochrome C domain-containing protein [Rubinisphaera italica]|uniref:Planctomycete cytochrome C n=1 Tax=Rubinisphaera italica TaxID=2527969 RepID=A0A5C5XGF4_9PLAN|nr:PSD1 and planctomycete cytochrome C domain-containing protein [Rubinisphaera italica]TWT61838.1 Planctomycete cytochrome C [Rubinisphaera italica]
MSTTKSKKCLCLLSAFIILYGLQTQIQAADPKSEIDFEKHVQPILRQHCFRCHGESHEKGGFRLSRKAAAFGTGDSEEALIIPGNAAASLLITRVEDADAGDLMPLDGEPLADKDIRILKKWINQGANWPDSAAVATHWAYEPIVRPEIPEVENQAWVKTPVDAFVLKQIQESGYEPAPELDRARWLRRVSLALIGLPPTPEQIEKFEANQSPEAYERAVEDLLASPRFGEKWAVAWLDLARYADSNGFQADQLRDSWAYRDWVISAFNQGMPIDQFVVEQLAGDLLPDATPSQKIATGFHRTVTCNVEAGVHPEQNRVNQVFDRVNTTGTVFLGTSMECAQCHDHKYDPFSQEDYYRLFAYFNNTPLEVKQTAGVTYDFYGPSMELPLPTKEQKQRKELQKQLADLQARQKATLDSSEEDYQLWLTQLKSTSAIPEWSVLTISEFESTGGETSTILEDQSVLVTGRIPGTTIYTLTAQAELAEISAIRVDALTHPEIPGMGPGRGDELRTNFILSEIEFKLIRGDKTERLELANAIADYSQDRWDVTQAIDGDRKTGWAIGQEFGKPHWSQFTLIEPAKLNAGDQIEIVLDQNYGRGRTIGCVRVSAFGGDPTMLSIPEEVRKLASTDKINSKDEKKLRDFYSAQNPQLAKLELQIETVNKKLKQIEPPTTLVMVEMDKPRKTHVLSRGDYLNPAQEVTAGLPGVFSVPDDKFETNRLGFARWLVSDENPLLARVTVNRWWTQIFGRGIVMTPEDFGTQGEPPTHPELLDWLADELRSHNWSMKHVLKQIVLSSTFRQSADLTPELLEADPDNALYARGPRFRMQAEMIRDNALAISGLLSEKMGGEPVMPFQPDGIWRSIGRNQPKWITAQDEDRFRRGIYIIWKRDAPYTSLMSFDAPDRTACVVKRPRTNTPLQALTLLNDPAYSEMALGLATRILKHASNSSDRERMIYGFQLAIARQPTTVEIDLLTELLESERATLDANPKLIEQRMKLKLKEFPEAKVESKELAVWFSVANVLLNLDETITQ